MAFGIFGWQKPAAKPVLTKAIISSDDISPSKKTSEDKESKSSRSAKPSAEKNAKLTESSQGDLLDVPRDGAGESSGNTEGRKIYEEVEKELSSVKKQGTSRKDISRLDSFFQQVEDDLGQLKNKKLPAENDNKPSQPDNRKMLSKRQFAQGGEKLPSTDKKAGSPESFGMKEKTGKTAGEQKETPVFNRNSRTEAVRVPVSEEKSPKNDQSLLTKEETPAEDRKGEKGPDAGSSLHSADKGAPGTNLMKNAFLQGRLQESPLKTALQQKLNKEKETPDNKGESAREPDNAFKNKGLSLFEKLQSLPPRSQREGTGLSNDFSLKERPKGPKQEDMSRKTAIIENDSPTATREIPRGEAGNLLMKEAALYHKKGPDGADLKESKKGIPTGRNIKGGDNEPTGIVLTSGYEGDKKTGSSALKQEPRDTADYTEKRGTPEKQSPLETMKQAILKNRDEKPVKVKEPDKNNAGTVNSEDLSVNAPEKFVTRDSLKNLSRSQLTASRLESQLGDFGKSEIQGAFFEELSERTSTADGRQVMNLIMESVSKNPPRKEALFRGMADFSSTEKGRDTLGVLFKNLEEDQTSCGTFLEGLNQFGRTGKPEENVLGRLLSNVSGDSKARGSLFGVLVKGSLGEKGANSAGSLMLQLSSDKENAGSFTRILSAGAGLPEGGARLGRMLESVGGDSHSSSRLVKMLNSSSESAGGEFQGFLKAVSESPEASTGFLVASSRASEKGSGHRQVADLLDYSSKDSSSGKSLVKILTQGSSTDRGLANTGRFLAAAGMDEDASKSFVKIIERNISDSKDAGGIVKLAEGLKRSDRVQGEFVKTFESAARTPEGNRSVSAVLDKMQDSPDIRKGVLSVFSGGASSAAGAKSLTGLIKADEGRDRSGGPLVRSIVREASSDSGRDTITTLFNSAKTDGGLSSALLKGFAEEARGNPRELAQAFDNIGKNQNSSGGLVGLLASATLREEGRNSLNLLMERAQKDTTLASSLSHSIARGASSAEGAGGVGRLMKNISESPDMSLRFLSLITSNSEGSAGDGKPPVAGLLAGISKDSDSSLSIVKLINQAASAPSGAEALGRITGEIARIPDASASFTSVLSKAASSRQGGGPVGELFIKASGNGEQAENLVKALSTTSGNPKGAGDVVNLIKSVGSRPETSDAFVKIMDMSRAGETRNSSDVGKNVAVKFQDAGGPGRLVRNIAQEPEGATGFIKLVTSATDTAHGQSLQNWLISSRTEAEAERSVELLSRASKIPEGREAVGRLFESASGNPRINSQLVSTLNRRMSDSGGPGKIAELLEGTGKDPRASSAFVKTMDKALTLPDSSAPARALLENISGNDKTALNAVRIISTASASEKGTGASARLLETASSDPKTASSLVGILNRSLKDPAGGKLMTDILTSLSGPGGSGKGFTGVIGSSLADPSGKEQTLNLLREVSGRDDMSAAFTGLLRKESSSLEGLGRLESLMEALRHEPGAVESAGRILAKATLSEKGRENFNSLIINCQKSEDAVTCVLSMISGADEKSATTVLMNSYDMKSSGTSLTSLLVQGSISPEGAQASAKILDKISKSPETSSGFIKSLLLDSVDDKNQSAGRNLLRMASSAATADGFLKVQASALSSEDGVGAFIRLQEKLPSDKSVLQSQLKLENSALQSSGGAESFVRLMDRLSEKEAPLLSYFKVQARAVSTKEGLEEFTQKMAAVSARPETATACLNAGTRAMNTSADGRETVLSIIKNAGRDKSASTAFVEGQSSASRTKEGQGALIEYFNSLAKDDHSLMAQFRMQKAADRDSQDRFSKAVQRDARLESAYNEAEGSYRHLENRYSKFQSQLNEASTGHAARKAFFRNLSQEISSMGDKSETGRMFDIASKDPDTWDRFSANLSILSASSDQDGTFAGFMKEIVGNKPVLQKFQGALAESVKSNEGLNQFEVLLAKSSENTRNQASLINAITAGIGRDDGTFAKLMNSVNTSGEAGVEFLRSTAAATSNKEGANGFQQALKELVGNTESREAYFRVWATALHTSEGREAFVVLSDNTKSSSKARNQFVETLTSLNSTEEGREIFARMVTAIGEDSASSKAFLEGLNRMSLDKKASSKLDDFIRSASLSKESREALSGVVGEFLSDKKGQLLMTGLARNNQLMETVKLDRPRFGETRPAPINMRGGESAGNNIEGSYNIKYLEKITSRPLIHLLSQQAGTTQSTAKDSRIFSKFDGLQMTLPSVSRVAPVHQPVVQQDINYRINNLSYNGRIFDAKVQGRVQELRLATVSSSSNKDKVEKIWIELNRRTPPMDPREIYQDTRLRYQMLCRFCDNQKNFGEGLDGKICGQCSTEYDRTEVMSSMITYTSKGGYINSDADVIFISPEAARIFEAKNGAGDLLDIQTTSLMPTLKDMLSVSRTGKNRYMGWQ